MTRDEIRTEWTRRLRSGKYKQAKYNLHMACEGYCCLGIAAEILVEEGVLTRGMGAIGGKNRTTFNGGGATLVEVAVTALGLVNESGAKRGVNSLCSTLTNLNDNGVSFSEIANRIDSGDYWEENDAS